MVSDLLEHLSLSAPLSPAASQPSSAFLTPGNLTAGRGPLHAVARGVSVGMASGEGHCAISWVRKKVKNRPQGSSETEVKVMGLVTSMGDDGLWAAVTPTDIPTG